MGKESQLTIWFPSKAIRDEVMQLKKESHLTWSQYLLLRRNVELGEVKRDVQAVIDRLNEILKPQGEFVTS